jgi:MFS family permease
VFLSYYLSSNIFPNTSALEYAFVGGLSISCAMLVSPLATHLARVFSTRLVLNLGALLETLSLISASFAKETWQLCLSQGVCFGVGMGFCFVGSVGVISHWFERRRSLVNGIAAAGSGFGGLVYSLATGRMIPQLGFPWAMRILGILCFVVNLTCGNLLRVRYHATNANQSAFHLPLLKRLDFVLLLLWGMLSVLGYVALLFSLSSYAVAVGLTQQQGSIASALLNLGQALGRPIVGVLSDFLGRLNVALACTFLAGLFCLVIWPFATSMGVICFLAVLVGMVAGTIWAVAAPLAAEVVGLSDLPSALSIFWLVLVPPATVAEAIALELREKDNQKPYLHVQILAGLAYIGAGLCLLWLKAVFISRQRRGKDK